MKNIDRLYIDIKYRKLLEEMNSSNLLNSKNASRKELFLYAMSLGTDAPTKINGKRDGLFLTKDLNTSDEALIYTNYINNEKDINELANKEKVYGYAERCANTGFSIIENYLENGNPETLDKRLLIEIEEKLNNNK
jgi:hypothetical protein